MHDIRISLPSGPVSGVLDLPPDARWLYVFAHGAGAGMRHRFMDQMARLLAGQGIGTLRYNFPYMEAGRKQPDRPPALEAAVRAAVEEAGRQAPGLPLLAGGKSMGGRMTSNAAARSPLPGVRGLVFFGFPLHPPGNQGTARAEHLPAVTVPMLFLQGTRDTFAEMGLIRGVVESLPRSRMHVVEGGDHSFHVLKSTGRTDGEVQRELAEVMAGWADGLGEIG